jgi:hypothetical protein
MSSSVDRWFVQSTQKVRVFFENRLETGVLPVENQGSGCTKDRIQNSLRTLRVLGNVVWVNKCTNNIYGLDESGLSTILR